MNIIRNVVFPSICFVMCLGCQSTVNERSQKPGDKNGPVIKQVSNPGSVPVKQDTIIQRITFGVFCGECEGHCATMFQYNMVGNANTMLADYTDSYFKRKVNCETPILNAKKMDIANDIVRHIPHKLIADTIKWKNFGCPDCTDGCGIYLAISREKSFTEFRIDYHTEGLDPEMKAFVEYLKPQIAKLKQP